MTSIITSNAANKIFEQYRKAEVKYTDENGETKSKKIGSDDNAIESEEFKLALDDMCNKFFADRPDDVYKEWIQKYEKIDKPITSPVEFWERIQDAIIELVSMINK